MTRRAKRRLLMAGGLLLVLGAIGYSQLPSWGAALLLHPWRRPVTARPPAMCREVSFEGASVMLKGWSSDLTAPARGTLIYLHGIADNRASGAGVLERFSRQGFRVIAYDSRAQGESGGDACTYGYWEKEDLKRVIDHLPPGPVVLLGSSLGGAIALQAAAIDRRISAVVAAESFSDLKTVAIERAPFFFTTSGLERALRIAERRGDFLLDQVSPEAAAKHIHVPVLLIHGAADQDTSPAHCQRIYTTLEGPKKLILVPSAKHNESLRGDQIWEEIDQWLESVVGSGRN